MGKVTFVVDFPDGREPVISAATDILGGKLLSVAFKDATQIDDLSMARFSLQCGAGWSVVLGEFIEDKGWKREPAGRDYEVITVPKGDEDFARELVKEIVPVIYRIDVAPDSL